MCQMLAPSSGSPLSMSWPMHVYLCSTQIPRVYLWQYSSAHACTLQYSSTHMHPEHSSTHLSLGSTAEPTTAHTSGHLLRAAQRTARVMSCPSKQAVLTLNNRK
mmetsp:Transcript_14715/g.32004  ORF Transcript_14715/g.32004 Transcript_14715/m.32004 type:complete len:104 (+) Transcript_14715:730-1041(+)